MPFSVGALEMLCLVAMAIPVGFLLVRRHRFQRLGIAAFVCALLAALVTPADVFSMGLLFVAFLGMFLFGAKFRLQPAATST